MLPPKQTPCNWMSFDPLYNKKFYSEILSVFGGHFENDDFKCHWDRKTLKIWCNFWWPFWKMPDILKISHKKIAILNFSYIPNFIDNGQWVFVCLFFFSFTIFPWTFKVKMLNSMHLLLIPQKFIFPSTYCKTWMLRIINDHGPTIP